MYIPCLPFYASFNKTTFIYVKIFIIV